MRQKKHVCPRKTDLEIFSELHVQDLWEDACLEEAYIYIRRGTKEHVPSSWETAMASLDSELASMGYQI